MNILQVKNKFVEAVNVILFLHWNTDSYAKHKALGKFYDSWGELTDKFIETYQGLYGRVPLGAFEVPEILDAVGYLTELRAFVGDVLKETAKGDEDLMNILADMRGEINHTLYLLTLK